MDWKRSLVLVASLVACGDAAPPGGGSDAGVDAGAGITGVWRLTAATVAVSDAGVLMLTDENQRLTDPASGEMHDYRVNGTMELTAAGDIAYVQQRVIDDTLPLARIVEPANFVTSYTASGATTGTLTLGGGIPTVGFVLEASPEKLKIQIDSVNALELQRYAPASTDTLSVRGKVTLAPGTPAFQSAHASLIFLLRSGFAFDPRDDVVLDFGGTDTATFQLDRTDGARGTERIVFGPPNVAIAVALIVVWDDVDGNSMPSPLLLEKCVVPPPPPPQDCTRGVSAVYLTYRSGSSTELASSAFGFIRPGWTQAIFTQDLRAASIRNGMTSIDGTHPVPFDVYVPPAPSQIFIPVLDF